jgi:hypothetical protein
MADRNPKRLPRGPQAPKLGPAEQTLKRSGADLQNGWLGRHGNLIVTDERLLFAPTVLDTLLGAKRRGIPLDDITEIERFPISPTTGMPRGGKRPRMLIHTRDTIYEFMVPDLDSWIDSLQRVYELRGKKGHAHAPTITREGYTNLLLDDG